MITEMIVDYLKNENVSLEEKEKYLETLNLQYSDIFNLKEIFKCDMKLYQILHGLTYYIDSSFYNKISYQNKKIKKGVKEKRRKDAGRKTL